jgi:hypothetical protein
MGEVESWFFEQIKNADCVVIYNKNVSNGKQIEGYIGKNTAIDIGCAIGGKKEVILVFLPIDVGVRGLYSVGLIKAMNVEALIRYLKERKNLYEYAFLTERYYIMNFENMLLKDKEKFSEMRTFVYKFS